VSDNLDDLKSWIKRNGKSQTWVAARLGVTRQHISNILHGRSGVSPEMDWKIERLTDGEVSGLSRFEGGGDLEGTEIEADSPEMRLKPLPLPGPGKRDRLSVTMDADVVERLRRVVYWSGGETTMSAEMQRALVHLLDSYQSQALVLRHPLTGEQTTKDRGQPFPPREGAIPSGRPATF
jgi:plasmid maintenance system antidote protein VapI